MGVLAPTTEHTHTSRHAPLSSFRITYLHSIIHTLKKSPRPSTVMFWPVPGTYPCHCFAWIWPPNLFLFSLSLICLHFFCLLMFFTNKWTLCKSCVSAMFTQQGQEDGKSYLAYRNGGAVQTRAVMPDTFRSIAKGRVRETRTVKISQNVLPWALQ